MRFASPLVSGKLIKRYKRFLADVTLEAGENITAACPNTAAMLKQGARAAMLYLVQAHFPERLHLASDLDPTYFKTYLKARKAGVEAYALCCHVSTSEITAGRAIPVEDP